LHRLSSDFCLSRCANKYIISGLIHVRSFESSINRLFVWYELVALLSMFFDEVLFGFVTFNVELSLDYTFLRISSKEFETVFDLGSLINKDESIKLLCLF